MPLARSWMKAIRAPPMPSTSWPVDHLTLSFAPGDDTSVGVAYSLLLDHSFIRVAHLHLCDPLFVMTLGMLFDFEAVQATSALSLHVFHQGIGTLGNRPLPDFAAIPSTVRELNIDYDAPTRSFACLSPLIHCFAVESWLPNLCTLRIWGMFFNDELRTVNMLAGRRSVDLAVISHDGDDVYERWRPSAPLWHRFADECSLCDPEW